MGWTSVIMGRAHNRSTSPNWLRRVLVSVSVPTPEELNEARAIQYMFLVALHCVLNTMLLGLVFLAYVIEFIPSVVLFALAALWILHLAHTLDGVWTQWAMHNRRLAKMEREYIKAHRLDRVRRTGAQPS